MIPTIEEIELSLMNSELFNFRQDLMVFRVSDFSGIVNHECDCLIMSKSGYLTEIEIKRSYSDFLADFKKRHTHQDPHLKAFYFLVHESFAEKAKEKLIELKHIPSGLLVYDDNAKISFYANSSEFAPKIRYGDNGYEEYTDYRNWNPKKLFLEEQYQLARLGAMRYKNMTERIIKNNNSYD